MQRRTFFSLAALPLLNVPFRDITDKPFVVEANQTRFNENLGGGTRNDLKVSVKDTDYQLSIFEIHSKGKGGGPALHIHYDQDETMNILEGEYLFQVGDQKVKLKTGDTIFIPRGTPHAFVHLGEGIGKKLSIYQPAGNIEEMFRQIGNLKERTPENVQKAMAVNNTKIVGKPLSAE
ncbi:MAG: cupin domain-containing protein [Spirosomataceae bacterium]